MARQASASAKDVPGQQQLMTFISDTEQRLAAIDTAYNEQWWCLCTGGVAPNLPSIETERAGLLLDEETWITVMRWVGALGPTNPVQRRTVLLGRELISASVESRPDVWPLRNDLAAEFVAGHPSVSREHAGWGELINVLHSHHSRHVRYQAWQAQIPLSVRFRDRYLELVRRRNFWARKQGYPNFIDLALAPQGLSRDSVLERFVELEDATAAPYRAFVNRMQHQLHLDRIAPWDITYLTHARMSTVDVQSGFAGGPEDILELIHDLGLPWESLGVEPVRLDNVPFPSLTWPVAVPNDIRVALNLEHGWGAYIETARAYGQALLAGLNRQSTFLLRQDAPTFREGMGAFLARLASEPVWLRKRKLLPEARLQRMAQVSLDLLVLRLRQLMSWTVFEYQVYEDPDSDLDQQWGKTQEAFLLLPNDPWGGWVATPDYILRAVNIQNQIIGEIIASQAISYLYQRFGYLLENPELTDFLLETYYGSGAVDDWIDKVRAATGKFLSNKALFGELVGEE